MNGDGSADDYVRTMRFAAVGGGKSFVVFENGTVVQFGEPHPELDLRTTAVELLRERGPVCLAQSPGDLAVVELSDDLGWEMQGCQHDIRTLLLAEEFPGTTSDAALDMAGRTRLGLDAESLNVVHVEDARPQSYRGRASTSGSCVPPPDPQVVASDVDAPPSLFAGTRGFFAMAVVVVGLLGCLWDVWLMILIATAEGGADGLGTFYLIVPLACAVLLLPVQLFAAYLVWSNARRRRSYEERGSSVVSPP